MRETTTSSSRRATCRHELLATTMLAGLALSPVSYASAQTATSDVVTLPTIDIVGKDGGPGGRFTGYSPDMNKPAAASKSKIPLLQYPASVQVIPREVLDDQQAIGLRDAILNNASSVAVGYQFYDQFIIRGFDVGANIYRNGLRTVAVTNRETANLQAIEVVKGPAAMLYGRIEPGGLINLVTKQPLLTPYVSVQEQAGSFGFTRTTIDATGPLTADNTLAYRFNGAYVHSNSFRNFVTNQNAFVAPTISYRPIEQFRLNVDGEYQNTIFVDDNDVGVVAIGTRPANIPISRYLEDPAVTTAHPNRQQRAYVGYDWTYDISSNWSLTNRFGYSKVAYNQAITGIGSINESTGDAVRRLWYTFQTREIVSANLDLNGRFSTGPLEHQVLVGTDYFKFDQPAFGFSGLSPFVKPVNIYNPIYDGVGLGGYTRDMDNFYFVRRESWKGLYAQDQISLADNRLHILLGGRYDWASFGSRFSPTSLAEALAFRSVEDKAFSPRAGMVVQPLPWLSFYGNYSQSFGTSGGISPTGLPLPPQKGTQYEGGVKAEFLDGRLTATMAYYDIVKTNILQPVPGTQFSIPVGEAESKGVEIDIAGRLSENWSVIGSYSHDDARITKDNNAAGTFGNTGHRLANVPLNAGNLWLKYDFLGEAPGLSLGAGLVVVGQRQGDNANTFQLPAYARVDCFAIYRLPLPGPALTAQLNIRNLFDTTYYDGTLSRFTIMPGAPRTFLASVRMEF